MATVVVARAMALCLSRSPRGLKLGALFGDVDRDANRAIDVEWVVTEPRGDEVADALSGQLVSDAE